ncbi:hypothetical protein [Cellulomonas sp. S1-8]|uniref:hypothetical protein n=1 Tax=Cellulomonas sp. S1-8 TaxID=2904790 RepID=UPI0022439447|nr:hypothetical protein [Cellulomonas sp. S1-8]UZN05132.1 hypothetical protein OKX07_09680 [Cellulomonas sp. S1-8]
MTTAPCDPATSTALHRLRPRPAAPTPTVVRRADVAASAWTGLHLDGVLVSLWRDTSRVAWALECAEVRARAFGTLVPRRGAVGRLSAAWVHVGGPPPDRVTVLVRSGARRLDPHPERATAEADLRDDDVRALGGVPVTTVLRTAVDIARWVPAGAALPVLRALLPAGLDPDAALRQLDVHAGGRGVRDARRVLECV